MLAPVKDKMINGIDVARLEEIVASIGEDVRNAELGFTVRTRWTGGTRSESVIDTLRFAGEDRPRSHKIVADEPTELGGGDSAANPQELLMAALNSCITVGYVAGAAMQGIALDSVEIETRGTLDLRGFLGLDDSVPPGYETVDFTVRIKGDAPRSAFEEIHQAVMKTSPNFFNLSRPIRLNGTLKVG
jgi:uncharacterized OsmC-like protein